MQLVSVVIPLYNTEAYIRKAIESICNQTYSNWELIICDDGSIDDSLKIAKEWQAKDERIKVLQNQENKGHIYTYNRLFFEAKGDYIMIQDSDDWSENTRIESQLNAIMDHNVDVCFTNSILHRANGTIYYNPGPKSGLLSISSPEDYDPATILFRRSILQTIPGFHAYFDRLVAMDRYFILECLSNFKCYYLNKSLYNVLARSDSDHRSFNEKNIRKISVLEAYRLLKDQRVKTGTDWLKQGKEKELLKFEYSLLKNKKFMSEKYRTFSCIQIDDRKLRQGLKMLMKAIKLNPLSPTNYKTLLYLIRSAV